MKGGNTKANYWPIAVEGNKINSEQWSITDTILIIG